MDSHETVREGIVMVDMANDTWAFVSRTTENENFAEQWVITLNH